MNNESEFGNNYRLVWRLTGMNQVGEVHNYTVDKRDYRRILICLDDDRIRKTKMRFLSSCWGNNGPEIFGTSGFMALPPKLRAAGIWHEVGHIHHEHHFSNVFCNQSQLRALRLKAVEKGTVLPMEAQADSFAVQQVGKKL